MFNWQVSLAFAQSAPGCCGSVACEGVGELDGLVGGSAEAELERAAGRGSPSHAHSGRARRDAIRPAVSHRPDIQEVRPAVDQGALIA